MATSSLETTADQVVRPVYTEAVSRLELKRMSIRRFVIPEKACTGAFSWLKAATTPLFYIFDSIKTL